jgi:RNA polymerase sigma-32 factor
VFYAFGLLDDDSSTSRCEFISAPGQNLEAYLNSIQNIAILSPEEERKLAEDLYYREDLEAARQLVMAHLRFVVHIARGYSGYGLPQADLIQEGNVGLMKAVRKFNPEVGVRLISFAVHWIRSEIHEYVLKNWKIVKVATTKAQRKLFFNLRNKKKDITWLSEDDVKMISNELDVKEDTVREMEQRMSSHDVSFDPYSADNSEEGNTYSPADYLTNEDSDPLEIVEKEDFARDQINQLQSAISDLDERSQLILKERWLTDDKPTLHELADKYGISAERIRQIEKKAMEKIRTNIN